MKAPRTLKAPKFHHSALEASAHPIPPNANFIIGAAPSGSSDAMILPRKKTRYNSPKLRLATTFKQELEKLGVEAMQLLPRNPSKDLCGLTDVKGLPFQRRARSQSPPRESLRPVPETQPPAIPRPVQVKFQLDDFSGLLYPETHETPDIDDDLEKMKRDYLALLEQVDCNLSTKNASSSDMKEAEGGGEEEDTVGREWGNMFRGKADV